MERKRENLRFMVDNDEKWEKNETEEVPSFHRKLNKVRERRIQLD